MLKFQSILGILISFCSYFLYSIHDGLIKYIGNEYHPFQTAFFAFLIGFVPVMLYVMILEENKSLKPKNWNLLFLRGILGGLNTPVVMYAFSQISVTEVYTILFCVPIWVTILSVFFLGEKIYTPRIIAILFGIIGVFIILNPTTSPISLGTLCCFFYFFIQC